MRKLLFSLGVLLALTVSVQAATALRADIKENGLNQGDLVIYLQNIRDTVNEMITDHATNRTTLVESKTAIDELIDDHATTKATVDAARTAIIELSDDHDADNAGVVADLKVAANKAAFRANNYVVATLPVLAIDSNFDVKNTEQTTFVAGGVYLTLNDNVNCDTGTSKTITSSQWGALIVEASAAATLTCTWASGSYASEALALAAARALTPATGAVIGIVAVQAHASGFTAGTDALEGGAGGNASPDTNYYDFANTLITAVSTSPASALSAADPAAGPATLTATKPTAPAATLTNSTALTLSAP